MTKDSAGLGHSPAVVAAHAPHADAGDGLRVERAVVHGVHQAQRVVLQDQVHVLPLGVNEKTGYLPHETTRPRDVCGYLGVSVQRSKIHPCHLFS